MLRVRRRPALVGTLAIILSSTCMLGARLLDPPCKTDEYFPLVCGQRILAGEVPFRDFVTQYPPLIYYLDALVMGAFAPTVIAPRVI